MYKQNMLQLAAVSQGQLWYCMSTYYRNKHIYQPHITCIIIHETYVLLYVKKCQNSLEKKLRNQFLGADSKSYSYMILPAENVKWSMNIIHHRELQQYAPMYQVK